jgi:formate dehydrogenase gamma subunit
MAGGGAALLASGVVMWFVAEVPWDLRILRYSATLVHAAAALVTIGGFIVHVYMGVAVVPGGLSAVIHGQVSDEWARRHHPLWLAELDATSGARHPAQSRRRHPGGNA